MKLNLNVGNTDRIVRVVLAVVFAALNLLGVVGGAFGIILWALALVLVITSALNFCPIYWMLKLSTRGK